MLCNYSSCLSRDVGGTIEMTVVLLCVILSVCVSITHLVPLAPPTSFIGYFWNFVDFRLYMYEDVHMVLNFWSNISDIITALVNWEIAIFKGCVHNSSCIIRWNLLKFRMFSYHHMTICMWVWIVESVSFKVTDEIFISRNCALWPLL